MEYYQKGKNYQAFAAHRKTSNFEIMKSMLDINEKKNPAVRIDSALEKYNKIILNPEKLAKANEQLKKAGHPKVKVIK